MKRREINELQVCDYLKLYKKVTVCKAMELTGASDSTVRRLFARLEQSGKYMRYYGGIRVVSDLTLQPDYLYDQVETKQAESKIRIGFLAARTLEEGDVIYLDSGTTLSRFAAALCDRCKRGELKNLTIFTNSLVNLDLLRDFNVNLLGGSYRNNRKDFCGYLTEEALRSLHFTKCFLGTDGFSPANGFTTTDFYTARLNELALAHSERRFVLMDSSKFFVSSIVSYSRQTPVQVLVTEECPEEVDLAELERIGLSVVTR